MNSAVFAAALLLAQAAPAVTPAPAPAPAAAADAKPDAGKPVMARRDQLLCKEEQVIGSHFPKKVCYTREQQEDRTRQDQQMLDRYQSQFSKQCPGPGC